MSEVSDAFAIGCETDLHVPGHGTPSVRQSRSAQQSKCTVMWSAARDAAGRGSSSTYLWLEANFTVDKVQIDLDDREKPFLGDDFRAHLNETVKPCSPDTQYFLSFEKPERFRNIKQI